jgi:hypothetical protein
LVGETGFAPARASAHEFLRLACIRSTTRRKTGAAGATCTPTRRCGAAVFKTARSTLPRTAANGRGGRIRTGTGHHAQRVLSPPCLHSNHAAIKWCGQRESHPQGLSSIGSSGRRVYCFATSANAGASTGTCALLAALPRQSVAVYGLDAKWSKRKDSHLRSPEGQRGYSASQLLLCHASKYGGSSGIRTRDLLLMRELRCVLRHRAKWQFVLPLGGSETGGAPR